MTTENKSAERIELGFGVRRVLDGTYLMAMTPKTDQPTWCVASTAAFCTPDVNIANALVMKLCGRGITVRRETIRRDTTVELDPLPTTQLSLI